MAYKLDKIDLALIEVSDRTFHITASTEIDGLKSSMADAGLMVPPGASAYANYERIREP